MPRRRAVDPTKAINITLPESLLKRVHKQLSHTDSRSAWISGAIRMRLKQTTPGEEISTRRLIALLIERDCVDASMHKLLWDLAQNIRNAE